MQNSISPASLATAYPPPRPKGHVIPRDAAAHKPKDIIDFGRNGVKDGDAMRVVLERSLDKLRAVVGEARTALGLPENAVVDTSAEATAGRIADFALGAFDKWYANHEDLGEDEARAQFAEFIGGAINQGIEEARGILSALNALNGETDANITRTSEIIQSRLDEFVQKGL